MSVSRSYCLDHSTLAMFLYHVYSQLVLIFAFYIAIQWRVIIVS